MPNPVAPPPELPDKNAHVDLKPDAKPGQHAREDEAQMPEAPSTDPKARPSAPARK